ncbi:hypothetical protein ES703_72412 [subsurface metagenome]
MKAELWYSVVVRDRHGKIISRERRKSKSFLKQWNQLVYVQMSQATISITDTGGNSRSIGPDLSSFNMDAAIGVITHGIRVGTENTAVAIDDDALETPLTEGAGAGQMNHWACTVGDPTVSAPNCSFLVSRVIVNSSGSEITVKEAGIYMKMKGGYYSCAVRDVFGTPQAVPNGGAITVNWTLQVTV